MKIRFFISSLAILLAQGLLAQSVDGAIDTGHETYAYAKTSLNQFKTLLAIPNDANFPDDIEKNVTWCVDQLVRYGFRSKRLETPSVPLLLAEQEEILPNQPTILYYFHIDGQPVDPSFWHQDSPYQATLKEEREGEGWVPIDWTKLQEKDLNPDWRIFARSASDDKSPFVMFLAALETMMTKGKSIPYNLKVVLDFEEEKGSPNLASAVKEYKQDLFADMLLIYDGPKHLSNEPTITFGARGIAKFTLKTFGPTFPQHSGHYGNYAPNPALRLSQLLASMKDERGRVRIPGFYDGIHLDEKTKAILAAVPDDEKTIRVKLGVGEVDLVGANYQEALQYPSLNIRGLSSAWVGKEARTIVPASAVAEVDIRLVVESDPYRLLDLVKKHIEQAGYFVIDRKPNSRERFMHPKIAQFNSAVSYRAFRTEFDSDLGLWVYAALKEMYGKDPIRQRTSGGSLPTTPFINTLDIPAVIVPLVNKDNNQHSPNENLRLGNYFDGVKTIYALLNRPFPG
ncbi:MAG: M20/M25/M40 family metallo-hydrolase [Bacteroidota bacterium]